MTVVKRQSQWILTEEEQVGQKTLYYRLDRNADLFCFATARTSAMRDYSIPKAQQLVY
jgi:hypothetical protein